MPRALDVLFNSVGSRHISADDINIKPLGYNRIGALLPREKEKAIAEKKLADIETKKAEEEARKQAEEGRLKAETEAKEKAEQEEKFARLEKLEEEKKRVWEDKKARVDMQSSKHAALYVIMNDSGTKPFQKGKKG